MAKCFTSAKHSVRNLFSAHAPPHDIRGEVFYICQAFCPNLFSAHTTSAQHMSDDVHGKVYIFI